MTATDQGQARAALRRSRSDRVLFGVCAGLGRYLGFDPVLVRIAFVLLAVFGGSGVLLYLIGLVAIPSEDSAGAPAYEVGATVASGSAVVLGAVLVSAGSLLLAARLVPGFGQLFAPLVLVGLGVVVILAGRR